MPDASAHAEILRTVALKAVADARAAWRKAHDKPTAETVRAAYRACVLATRSLRRLSETHPDDEDGLLEMATLLDETGAGLKLELVRLIEPPAAHTDS